MTVLVPAAGAEVKLDAAGLEIRAIEADHRVSKVWS
jgi:hypothetical protein